MEFNCKFNFQNEKLLDSKIVDDTDPSICKISEHVENNKRITTLTNSLFSDLKIHLSQLSYGFFNKDLVNNQFSDDLSHPEIQNFKDFIKTRYSDDFFGIYINDDLKISQIFIRDLNTEYDQIPFLNKQCAINLTYQLNVSKYPKFQENKIKIKQIFDQTRPVADENQLRELFSRDVLHYGQSYDCSLPEPTTNDLSQNQMFLNNVTEDLVWDLTDNSQHVSVHTKDGEKQDSFQFNKIYKCKSYFNIVPFTKDPTGLKSICGFGFGQGDNDIEKGINANLIFIQEYSSKIECIMKARALQGYIIDKCTQFRQSNKDECYQDKLYDLKSLDKENREKNQSMTPEINSELTFKSDKKSLPEDASNKVEPKQIQSDLAINNEDSNDKSGSDIKKLSQTSEMEKLNSAQIDFNNISHLPSGDIWDNLNKIVDTNMIQNKNLDPKYFFKSELISENKEKQFSIKIIDAKEQEKLQSKLEVETESKEQNSETSELNTEQLKFRQIGNFKQLGGLPVNDLNDQINAAKVAADEFNQGSDNQGGLSDSDDANDEANASTNGSESFQPEKNSAENLKNDLINDIANITDEINDNFDKIEDEINSIKDDKKLTESEVESENDWEVMQLIPIEDYDILIKIKTELLSSDKQISIEKEPTVIKKTLKVIKDNEDDESQNSKVDEVESEELPSKSKGILDALTETLEQAKNSVKNAVGSALGVDFDNIDLDKVKSEVLKTDTSLAKIKTQDVNSVLDLKKVKSEENKINHIIQDLGDLDKSFSNAKKIVTEAENQNMLLKKISSEYNSELKKVITQDIDKNWSILINLSNSLDDTKNMTKNAVGNALGIDIDKIDLQKIKTFDGDLEKLLTTLKPEKPIDLSKVQTDSEHFDLKKILTNNEPYSLLSKIKTSDDNFDLNKIKSKKEPDSLLTKIKTIDDNFDLNKIKTKKEPDSLLTKINTSNNNLDLSKINTTNNQNKYDLNKILTVKNITELSLKKLITENTINLENVKNKLSSNKTNFTDIKKIITEESHPELKLTEEELQKSKRKILHFRDKIISNHSFKNFNLHYCQILKDYNINGRGKNLNSIDLIQSELKKICPEIFAEEKSSNEANQFEKLKNDKYQWFDIEHDKNITRKKFKTFGQLNGDILEQKEGCCQTFTSTRAALFAEWCHSTMRYKFGTGKFHFVSLYGQPVDPQVFIDEFTKDSCADIHQIMDELKETNPDVKVTISENTPKIIDGDITTITNADGSVQNVDPTSESRDTIRSNQTIKNDIKDSGGQFAGESGKIKNKGNDNIDKEVDEGSAFTPIGDSNNNGGLAKVPKPVHEITDAKDPNTDDVKDQPFSTSQENKTNKQNNQQIDSKDINYTKYDIGNQEIWVDSNKIATIRSKDGKIKNQDENIVEGQQQGDIIQLKFKNGDEMRYQYLKNELVRISADKNIISKIYPDNSKIIDNKLLKTKELDNKQGISTKFDVEHNQFYDTEVKHHFKYGNDVVQEMKDGSIVTKKGDGSTLILNSNNDQTVLDKEGKVLFTNNQRFKLHQNMALRKASSKLEYTKINRFKEISKKFRRFENNKPLITDIDNKIEVPFYQSNNSQFERIDGKLQEILPYHIKLTINKNGSKTRQSKDQKEVCYPNQNGQVFNRISRFTFQCNCQDQLINNWSCKKSNGYQYVKKILEVQNFQLNKKFKEIKIQKKYNHQKQDFNFMEFVKRKMNQN